MEEVMTRYLTEEKFLVTARDPEAQKRYAENWERTFGEKKCPWENEELQSCPGSAGGCPLPEHDEPTPTTCEKCGRSIDDININWNAPREPVCVVCACPKK